MIINQIRKYRMTNTDRITNTGKMSAERPLALLVAILFIVAGCGYHIAGKGGQMPGDIKSLSIPIFTNSTSKPDIESAVTQAFVDEFANTLKIKNDGDVVMAGNIKAYALTPVSFTQNDVNQEYRLTVTMSLVITRGQDNPLWQDDDITDYEDFTVNISDVTATKEAEFEALKKIAADTARFTKERIMEQF